MDINVHRLMNLFHRDIIVYFRWIIGAVLILIFLFFAATAIGHNFINLSGGGAMNPIMVVFFIALFIGGPILTASGLGHFHTASSRLSNLLLPASTLEKVFMRWFYTMPFFVLILAIVFYIFFEGYVSMYGHYFLEETANVANKLSTKMVPYFILLYGVGHSIALFFAHLYNRHVVIKGGLASIGIFLLIGLVQVAFGSSGHEEPNALIILENVIMKNLTFIGDDPFRLVWLAPVFWVLTYWIARRKQI